MPQYTASLTLAHPVAAVFACFATPAQLVRLAPPELHLELLEGPERLQAGARLRWKVRRWGISQQLLTEIIACEENVCIVEEQRKGPFTRWVLTRRFETTAEGTLLQESVDFEPPRGMLGRLVTAEKIEVDLERLFAYRAEKLRELLGS